MADAHKNFAVSLVATAPSPASSGTSLVVTAADGTKFPAVPFNATIWPATLNPTTANAEIVRVTAISTDTFTITRTQESTSARTVVVGDQIAATITAKTLTDVEYFQTLTKITSAVTVINTTTETDVLNYTVPAGAIGTDKTVRAVLAGTMLHFDGANGASNEIRVRVYLAGTVVFDSGTQDDNTQGIYLLSRNERMNWYLEVEVSATGATNSQFTSIRNNHSSAAGASTSGGTGVGRLSYGTADTHGSGSSNGRTSVDLSGAWVLRISIAHQRQIATSDAIMEHARVQVIG